MAILVVKNNEIGLCAQNKDRPEVYVELQMSIIGPHTLACLQLLLSLQRLKLPGVFVCKKP